MSTLPVCLELITRKCEERGYRTEVFRNLNQQTWEM